MDRQNFAKIVTANDLLSGEVVYLRHDGHWSPDHSDAELLVEARYAADRLAGAKDCHNLVVSAYLADARLDENRNPAPVLYREKLRTLGPSNLSHGKQEGLAHFSPGSHRQKAQPNV